MNQFYYRSVCWWLLLLDETDKNSIVLRKYARWKRRWAFKMNVTDIFWAVAMDSCSCLNIWIEWANDVNAICAHLCLLAWSCCWREHQQFRCCCCVHSGFNEIHFWRCALSCDNFCDAMWCSTFGMNPVFKVIHVTYDIQNYLRYFGFVECWSDGNYDCHVKELRFYFFFFFKNANQTQYICIFYMHQFIYMLLLNILRTPIYERTYKHLYSCS